MSPRAPLAFTLLLSVGTIFACGGTTSPEPNADWEKDACEAGIFGASICDKYELDEPVAMAGAGGGGGGGAAGGGMGGDGGGGAVEYCDAVDTIFKKDGAEDGCSGSSCHNSGSFFGAFADEPAAMFQADGADACAFIDTTNPENSKIYARLSGEGPCAGVSFMPQGAQERYSDEGLTCVLSWLTQFSAAAQDVTAGGGGGAEEMPAVPDVPCDAQRDVFQAGTCANGGCHDSGAAFGGFGEDPPADFFNEPIVSGDGCLLIDTANPADSAIYGRISGEGACAGNGFMPPGASTALPASDVECVLSWLTQFEGQ